MESGIVHHTPIRRHTLGMLLVLVALVSLGTAGRAVAQPVRQVPLQLVIFGQTAADREGFTFTVVCSGMTQTVTSPAGGSIDLMVPAGTCTVRVATKTGYTLVSLVAGLDDVSAGQTFTVPAPDPFIATVTATFRSTQAQAGPPPPAGPTANVSFDLVLDPDAPADQADFRITVTCGTFSRTLDFTRQFPALDVPVGSCTLQVTPKPGYTVRAIENSLAVPVVTIANGGTMQFEGGVYGLQIRAVRAPGAPAQAAQPAAAAQPAPAAQGATESVPLYQGCNVVASTFPAGTTTRQVAAAVTPASALQLIWHYNNETGRFTAYSPNPNFPSDFTTVARFDAYFICVNANAQFNRPAV